MTMKPSTVARISAAVDHARSKHPWPHEAGKWARFVVAVALVEEVGEAAKALLEGRNAQFKAECYDAIAVLVRLIEGE